MNVTLRQKKLKLGPQSPKCRQKNGTKKTQIGKIKSALTIIQRPLGVASGVVYLWPIRWVRCPGRRLCRTDQFRWWWRWSASSTSAAAISSSSCPEIPWSTATGRPYRQRWPPPRSSKWRTPTTENNTNLSNQMPNSLPNPSNTYSNYLQWY